MKEIKLSKGMVALVDDEDFDWLSQWKWCEDGKGYAVRRCIKQDGKSSNMFMHRQIVGLEIGDPMCVDHVDENGLNNQRSNLRKCTRSENARNIKLKANNTSGYKGVSFFRRDGTWKVQIQAGGKNRHVGYFKTKEEAHKAYVEHAKKKHGEFANPGDGCLILKVDDVSSS